nr:MAG TPA: hypothetical protein [Caudoviricetes sp.]
MIGNDGRECLKITRIGQSAAEHLDVLYLI